MMIADATKRGTARVVSETTDPSCIKRDGKIATVCSKPKAKCNYYNRMKTSDRDGDLIFIEVN